MTKFSLLLLILCFGTRMSLQGMGEKNPTGSTGSFNGEVMTAGGYDPFTGNAKRVVEEITVEGAIGDYPLKWTRTLNTRTSSAVGGLGPGGWWHHYSYGLWIKIAPCQPEPPPGYEGPQGQLTLPDGRRIDLIEGIENGTYFQAESLPESGLRYIRDVGNGAYDAYLIDGGIVHFEGDALSCGTRTPLARKIVDPHGQATTLTYEGPQGVLSQVTEPGGRSLQLSYTSRIVAGNNQYLISTVEAFDGRGNRTQVVTYSYTFLNYNYGENPPSSGGYGPSHYLTRVDYDDDTHAEYEYQRPNRYYFAPVTGVQPAFGLIKTCRDVRFAGPMNNIEYEFAPGGTNPPPEAGQVKAEKNLTHEIVSQVTYPTYPTGQSPPANTWRTETRGDNTSRTLNYQEAFLHTYTDFQNHSTTVDRQYLGVGLSYRETITDARQKTTTIDRNSANQITVISHPAPGNAVAYYHYGDEVYLTSKTDENGSFDGDPAHTTEYVLDLSPGSVPPVNHRVSRINHPPGGGFEEFTYNQFGQVVTHRFPASSDDRAGGLESFEYDSRGLKRKHWQPATATSSSPTIYEYYGPSDGDPSSIDRLRRVIDPRGNASRYEYNKRGQITKTVHEADPSYIENSYNADGTLQWTTDERHMGSTTQRTNYVYDDFKRVVSITNPMNETTNLSYAPWSADGQTQTGYSYSHTTPFVFRETAPSQKVIDRGWDDNRRAIWIRTAAGTSEEATTYSDYDEVGNLASVRDPRGYTTSYGYDERNRKKSETPPAPFAAQVTDWTYDAAGNSAWEIKPALPSGVRPAHLKEYDSMNRVKFEHEWANPQTERITTYEYFPSGSLRKVIDPENKPTEFTYDDRGQKLTMKYPNGNVMQGWLYDPVGNMTIRPTADQTQTQLFSYDSRNRMQEMHWSNGIDWSAFGYDYAGNMTSAANPYSSITRIYDDVNRLVSDRQSQAASLTPPPTGALTPAHIFSRQVHGAAGAFDIDLTPPSAVECRMGAADNTYTLVLDFTRTGPPVSATGASMAAGIGSVAGVSNSGGIVTVTLRAVSDAQRLTVNVAVTDGTVANLVAVPMQVLIGDTNGSGSVNSSDTGAVTSQSGQQTTIGNCRSDLNLSGGINSTDIAIVRSHSGINLPPAPPLTAADVTVAYEHEADGRVKHLYATSAAYDLGFEYDATGRFQKITSGLNGPLRHEYVYDAAGNVKERRNPGNNTSQVYEYDQRNRVAERTINAMGLNGAGSPAAYEFSHEFYDYDAISRLDLTERHLRGAPGGMLQLKADSFAYNDASELASASYNLVVTPAPPPTPTPSATPLPTPTPPPPGQVAQPVIAPVPGDYPALSYPKTISIHTDTEGATMRYTLSNVDPTPNSGTPINGVSGNVSVYGGDELRVIAYKPTMTPSDITRGQYNAIPADTVVAPSFGPSPGSYASTEYPKTVTLTTPTSGALICYTNDGQTPAPGPYGTCTGIIASGGTATVEANARLQAIAFKEYWNDSALTAGQYTAIGQVATPVFDPGNEFTTCDTSVSFSLSTLTPNATIYWRKGGESAWRQYPENNWTGTINGNVYLEAKAIANGMSESDVAGCTYYRECNGNLPNTLIAPRTVIYQPDKAGNRLSVTADGMQTGYAPNLLNQYETVGSTWPTHGSEHEIAAYQTATAGTVSYRYLGDTRLRQASSNAAGTYDLGYDALGRTVRRTSNGVASFYIYDGERSIIELASNGAIIARNTYGIGIDEILARDTGGLYYHQDRLGNVSAITDGLGRVVEQYRYDAFGTPEIRGAPLSSNPNGTLQVDGTLVNNRFLFTGREWAAPYGFYEYRNRAYHPGLGRFMSEDPMGLQAAGGKPSGAGMPQIAPGQVPAAFAATEGNLYRYCGGDPVNRTDPMGLFEYVLSKEYPQVGRDTPGGREAVDSAIVAVKGTTRGAELFAMDPGRIVPVKPTTETQPTGYRNGTLYLNPKDRLFLDPHSRKAFDVSPREKPGENATGRAVIMGHETGHSATKGREKDEPDSGHNVRDNENPIRRDLGLGDRPSYNKWPIR